MSADELILLDEFLEKLRCHAIRKRDLYDGTNRDFSVDEAIRFAVEELGEIASAETRNRPGLARSECIDLAHCSFLVYVALSRRSRDLK